MGRNEIVFFRPARTRADALRYVTVDDVRVKRALTARVYRVVRRSSARNFLGYTIT